MGEMKPTPGPWNFYTEPQPNGCPIVGNSDGLMVAMVAHSVNYQDQKEAALSDARLIAEAGTVFHNTGLSPVQLVEMVKELKATLDHMQQSMTRQLQLIEERAPGKFLDKRPVVQTLHMHANRARAALAKCEGVK